MKKQEIIDFEKSIKSYAFPVIYYDFNAGMRRSVKNMSVLEIIIKDLLLSSCLQQVKDGLANIVYWGNANAGYQMYRTNRFMDNVTNEQIRQFQSLVLDGNVPTLQQIKQIKMPQFSGVSFISKIIAFIDPINYSVLDLLIAKLRNAKTPASNALYHIMVTTQISVTTNNSAVYDAWCKECQKISTQYYDNKYRAVDVERGFFNLIQEGKLNYAQQIYNAI